MINFLKGIVVGVGGIAPGLSGSVLLVIFGLYEKAINAIGTIFKNFKENLKFLVPLVCGFGVGVLLFSKIVDFFLNNYEMQTRYAFLGLILGTLPLFLKEVKKNGFSKKYYIHIICAAIFGIALFTFNGDLFPPVTNPSLFQSVLLGVAVAASSIVPGVDSAVILSSLGLYELYVSSLADLKIDILIPAAFGLIIGALLISVVMNTLIKKFYTGTFSIIFGLFISIIPSVLRTETELYCTPSFDFTTAISIVALLLGFALSFFLSDVEKHTEKIKKLFSKKAD